MGLFFSPFKSKPFLLALIGTLTGVFFVVKGQVVEGARSPPWAIWSMRIGISFIAAFAFAFLVRRAVKWALIIGSLLIAAAYMLNKLGIGISQQQIADLQDSINAGAENIQHAADSAWASVKPHLPSSGAAGAGLWRGMRHKVLDS